MELPLERQKYGACEVITLADHDGLENLAYEEALFAELRQAPRPVCLFYVNDSCVVVGRANRLEEWVNATAVEADGIPLIRRFSGGGAVYHDRDCLNFSFLVPKMLLEGLLGRGVDAAPSPSRYIDFFRAIVIRALWQGGLDCKAAGVSDITLNGRKISGNAQRIAPQLVLHHGTLLRRCPLALIERYLPVPPNRPGIPHAGFVSGLAEEGCEHTELQLRAWLAAEFCAACNV